MPKTLDMNDIGNYRGNSSQPKPIATFRILLGQLTYEDDSYHGEDQKGDVLLPGVLGLFHRLPRLHNSDLLLL